MHRRAVGRCLRRLGLLASAQRNEVAVALEHAIDLGRIGSAVERALALLGDHEHGRQTILKRCGMDRHSQLLKGLGHEDFRRVRLAVVCFTQVANIATVIGKPDGNLGVLLASVMPSHFA